MGKYKSAREVMASVYPEVFRAQQILGNVCDSSLAVMFSQIEAWECNPVTFSIYVIKIPIKIRYSTKIFQLMSRCSTKNDFERNRWREISREAHLAQSDTWGLHRMKTKTHYFCRLCSGLVKWSTLRLGNKNCTYYNTVPLALFPAAQIEGHYI